jgi:hypothetical protein
MRRAVASRRMIANTNLYRAALAVHVPRSRPFAERMKGTRLVATLWHPIENAVDSQHFFSTTTVEQIAHLDWPLGVSLLRRLGERYTCLFFGVSAHSPDGRNCCHQADNRQSSSDCSSLISRESVRQQKRDPRSKHGAGRDDHPELRQIEAHLLHARNFLYTCERVKLAPGTGSPMRSNQKAAEAH